MATLEGVDRRLLDVVDRVRRDWASRGYRVDYTPAGGRDRGKRSITSQHVGGRALDVEIYDPSGNKLDNYQNGRTFRTYEQFAQDARRIQQRDYPELDKALRWGGYFSGKTNYGAVDLMHLDLGGLDGLGMGGGSWAKGLNNTQRGYYPDAVSVGIGQMDEAAKAAGFGVPRAGGLNLDSLSSSTVKSLQTRLNAAGFKGADGERLTVDGIAGKNTEAAVQAAISQAGSLSADAPRDQVRAVQAALNAAGVTDAQGNPLREDGIIGGKTRAAIEKAAGFGVAPVQQSKLSALDQLMKDVPPAPEMSMAPAVRPSLMAGVPPKTSASASISGPPSSAAGQFSPKPGIGLSLSGALKSTVNPSGSGSFAPTPSLGRPGTFGQAVPSGPDPRAAGLYAPTQAANPRIAGAFESLKGPSSLHLAADLMRKAQGIPATPPQSPFAGSPERASVRAAVGDSPFAGTPERASLRPAAPAPMPSGVSRGWGGVTGAPLPSHMSPGPVQPRGPLQIGALVQDMRAAPKLASGRAPMDLNPGLAASQFHGGAASMPMSPDQRMLQSIPLGPYGVTGTHSPALKTSGQVAPQAPLAFAGGTFAPQARSAMQQISGTASPSPLTALASASVSPRPVQPKGVGSLALSPEARPSLRPPALSRPPLPTVTAPMSFPSGSLPPLGPPQTIGTLPTVDVPLSPAPPPAPPPMAPPPSFAPPPMARPPVLPALPPLAMLGKPIGKAAGSLQDLLGGLFRGPGMVQAAIAAGNKGGKFSSKDFWDKFNSFPGSGKGGGAVGLEGMASYAAAREAGMGGREKSKSKGSGKKK